MTTPATAEVIYEVECLFDPEIAEDFDAWLPGHVRTVLACEGFTAAEIQAPTDVQPGQPVIRRTQYRLQDMAALERYLEQDAPQLRADAATRFGDKATFTRRVLLPRAGVDHLAETPFTCLNCGALVPGKYCASCGQSRGVHVLSMHEVLGDVTHSLLHLDSRVWRTLRTLVLQPGQLTNEFIAGRHQRYLPPFRLYLVISVFFFALSTLLPGAQAGLVSIDKDSGPVAPVEVTPLPGKDAVATHEPTPTAGEQASRELRRALGEVEATADAPAALRRSAELAGAAVDDAGPKDPCNIDIDIGIDLPAIRRLNPLLKDACLKARADHGARLGDIFLSTAPKLMFVFLPLMAGVTMLFYWRPRRLYAEHLVAFLHSHAFMFLALAATSIVNAVMRLDLPLVGVLDVLNLVVILYIPYYVFRTMRVVYANGRALTIVKFTLIGTVYFMLLGVTMLIGIVYSLLSL